MIWRYGEEKFSRRIARLLVERRQEAPIETTRQLAELVSEAVPRKERHKHPATRTFQAIRIFINRELEDLEVCLRAAAERLAPVAAGGDQLSFVGRPAGQAFHEGPGPRAKVAEGRAGDGGSGTVGFPVGGPGQPGR